MGIGDRKLTKQQVNEIRALVEKPAKERPSYREMAKLYGISISTISKIRNNWVYRDIE